MGRDKDRLRIGKQYDSSFQRRESYCRLYMTGAYLSELDVEIAIQMHNSLSLTLSSKQTKISAVCGNDCAAGITAEVARYYFSEGKKKMRWTV